MRARDSADTRIKPGERLERVSRGVCCAEYSLEPFPFTAWGQDLSFIGSTASAALTADDRTLIRRLVPAGAFAAFTAKPVSARLLATTPLTTLVAAAAAIRALFSFIGCHKIFQSFSAI